MISFTRIVALSVLLAPLSACISVGHPALPNELYRLETQPQAAEGKPLPVSIRIAEPDAAPGLDTARIAVQDTANHLTYYNGVAWAQSLPQMLQGFLVDQLQRSHGFKSVSSDEEGIAANVELLVDIRDYEVENTLPNPTIHVRLVANLVNARTDNVITTFSIEKTATAEVNHMPAIIAAFNRATGDATSDMLRNVKIALAAK